MNKLDKWHWTERAYKQRVTRKDAQNIPIEHPTIIYKGTVTKLGIKHVGAGVYEISKLLKPLTEGK